MKPRNADGTFVKCGNKFKKVGSLIYCYSEDGELLFFTDDKRVMEHSWGKNANGYYSSNINGKQTPLHRYIANPSPNEIVDHINRDKKDNRICNLRNTNKSVNAFNCGLRSTNKSGRTGVYLRKDTKRWQAEIKKDGRKILLGCYSTFEEAVKAREEAENTYYGNK